MQKILPIFIFLVPITNPLAIGLAYTTNRFPVHDHGRTASSRSSRPVKDSAPTEY